jgi:hypothetical protein
MSGHGKRETSPRVDATAWRDRVIGDVKGEGRDVAKTLHVSADLIIAAAEAIAESIAVGESVISRADLALKNRLSGGLVSDRQVMRALRFLEARGHIAARGNGLIRPIVRRDGKLPLA